MAQNRIQDGLGRLVEHFLSNKDDENIAQTLEVCKRLLDRFIAISYDKILMIERMMRVKLLGMSNTSVNSSRGDVFLFQVIDANGSNSR
jgi:hypothetical protein